MTDTDQTVAKLDHAYDLLRKLAREVPLPQAEKLLAAATHVFDVTNDIVFGQKQADPEPSEYKIIVRSETRKGVTHVVTYTDNAVTNCTCEDRAIRGHFCKHMRKVSYDKFRLGA